eukprot:m.233713 g.233713  ORF g.233713 m.233713 type:complete len:108 (+) comp40097_c1_seq2:310-633(+)
MSWSESEVKCLINLWGEDAVQAQLEGCKRNSEVYRNLAAQMEENGYERSGDQCRAKMKKLKGEYRKARDNNNETGRSRKTCKFFEEMDAVLVVEPLPKKFGIYSGGR